MREKSLYNVNEQKVNKIKTDASQYADFVFMLPQNTQHVSVLCEPTSSEPYSRLMFSNRKLFLFCFLNVKKIESNVNRGKITFPDCQQNGAKMRVRPLLMRTQTSESKSCAATDSHEMEIKAALMYIKISRNIMLIEYNQTSAMSFLTLRYEFSLLMSTLLCSQCLL